MEKPQKSLWDRVMRYKILLMMAIPCMIWLFIFAYLPVWGWIMAFQDYNPGLGILKSPFAGLKHFRRFFRDPNFIQILRNTMAISSLNIITHTIFPITFALLLNEVMTISYKRVIQTVSYLPHFISYVVVSNLFLTLLAPSGAANDLLVVLGIVEQPIFFFAKPKLFWFLVAGINIWKECGWTAIIYLAAVSSIDPQLYEAATIDGAGRWRRMWNITLSGIMPTIVVLLIMSIPDLLNAGFEPSFLLGNGVISDYSEVIDTYVYNRGIAKSMYSFATAVGLLRTAFGLILIVGANKFARSVSEYGIY